MDVNGLWHFLNTTDSQTYRYYDRGCAVDFYSLSSGYPFRKN